jgi:hypothetical protein
MTHSKSINSPKGTEVNECHCLLGKDHMKNCISKFHDSHCSPDRQEWEEAQYFEFKTIEDRDKWIVWMKIYEEQLLLHQRQELLREIKTWTKGKTVTREKLRNYLNLLIKEK